MFRTRTRPPSEAQAAPGLEPDAAIAEAERLQDAGDVVGAIDVLTRSARTRRDPRIERRLVRFRHRAFASAAAAGAQGPGPVGVPDDPFPEVHDRPPEVACAELNADILRGAIAHHGCLLVRGVLDAEQVETAVAGIDRSFQAQEAVRGGGRDRWYDPLDPPGRNLSKLREWVEAHGGMWLGDSPPMLFEVLEAYEAAGVLSTLADYMGERPAMSLEKSTLRRMPPADEPSTWHQDGAFIDDGVRTVNVWVALTDCGAGAAAAGLDVIPRRFEEVFATGAPIAGAGRREGDDEVGHAISDDLAGGLTADTAASRPSFAAGDGLLFDEMMPHRTANAPGLTEHRYALESWFFAPSTFPRSYVPIVC